MNEFFQKNMKWVILGVVVVVVLVQVLGNM